MSRQSSPNEAGRADLRWDGEPLRPTTVTIDRAALVHNFRQLRQIVRDAGVLAVVKANAYGHGAVGCAKVLAAEGVDFLGVGLIEEGMELRRAGIETPILVVDGAFAERFDLMLSARLVPLVFRREQLEGLAAASRQTGLPAVAHLKIDTGMGRLGLQAHELGEFLEAAAAANVRLEGLATHLATADLPYHPQTQRQLDRLQAVAKIMRDKGFEPRWTHAANSAALLDREESHLSLVRAGMLLYGCHPSEQSRGRIALRPVLRWTTEITHLKEVPAGTPISYGARWVASRPSRIATLPVGYADGYRRQLGDAGELLIRGKRVRIAGTVTMDQIMVDVTDVEGVSVGDEAVIIGAQGDEVIEAEELARACGTIHYEIFCGIGPRVPRRFVG